MEGLSGLPGFGGSMKVFLDTNVLIDYLLRREPFYRDAKKVFELCLYKIDGFVTPHSLIDVFYMLSERTDAPVEYCQNTILKLRAVLNVVGEDDAMVFSAANNTGFPDFEDSMQYESALSAGVDCILTRNPKDFRNSRLAVCSPVEFLKRME